ncbi:hypothetical protein GALMADRAFT_232761 [Galerina marginata CBS 339.88]|uniref:Uncharacterized protein n=1 Tax=Galerina marginata (strain CBS 339.88) TaxID=685588 RepID=A0A067SEB0_GALM3|nr:hypothetical protein GALMADRAFT_232761 [Galerina marginata CBS 339.88]
MRPSINVDVNWGGKTSGKHISKAGTDFWRLPVYIRNWSILAHSPKNCGAAGGAYTWVGMGRQRAEQSLREGGCSSGRPATTADEGIWIRGFGNHPPSPRAETVGKRARDGNSDDQIADKRCGSGSRYGARRRVNVVVEYRGNGNVDRSAGRLRREGFGMG